MKQFIAHIRTDKNKIKDLNNPHTLKEHIEGVKDIALSFDKNSKWNDYIKLAALLHDIGKYSQAFQNYIRDDNGKRGSVHHAKYGAIVSRI